MKKFIKLAIFGLFACVCLSACSDDEPVSNSNENNTENSGGGNSGGGGGTTTTTPNYSLTASNHPRVIYTDDDFENIKSLLEAGTNPYLTQIHNIIITMADGYVGAGDLEYKLSGKRLLTVCRNAQARLLSCAYAYKITGEKKYLEQAEQDIKTVCNFQDWNCAQHTLDPAEMGTGVALAYDWLYNDLSSSSKSLAVKAINDFAFTPVLNEEWSENFYEVTNNWNSVCNGGLVTAALSIYETGQTTAQSFIDKAMSSNVAYMTDSYSPDGNYPEGYMYWNFGTMFEVLLLTAMETATGSDNGLSSTTGFSKTGKYQIYMEGPSGGCFNYSDCDLSCLPCLAQWYFAWKFKDYSVLYLEKDRISSYKSADEYRLLPLVAWYASKINVTDIPAPTDQIYHGDGLTPVVLIHDTWTMDSNDKFLGIKGGNGRANHAHLDAGSFVYDADGYRWASDLGGDNYTTLESYLSGVWTMTDGSNRWTKVFRYNNFNHNTITVNDGYYLSAGFADITEVIDDGTRKGAVVDISAPLADEVSSAVRTIYMEGEDLVIEDKITAKSSKSANVRWTMVTRANPTVDYGIITMKQNSKTRYMTFTSSTGHQVTPTTWSTSSGNAWDGSNNGYYECGYTTNINSGTTAIITVRLTPVDPLDF